MERGERAPDFVLPRPDGTAVRFYASAGGRPAVLMFAPSATDEAVSAAVAAAQGTPATVHLVVREPADADALPEGVAVLLDAGGKVTDSYRVQPDVPTALVLDPNLRVRASGSTVDPALLAPVIEPDPAPVVAAQAPVLYVPDVLDEPAREALIRVWEEQGHVETGVERSAAGRREDALAPTAKRRQDHTVTDPELLRDITTTVGRRVMPELRKAFAYRATRFEGFKIACYDAESGGFFTAHRDNLSPATAHRRFALTLNLNDGYEGGHLRFPEYGPMRYRPAAGEALLFSCAHLHEVLPVTSGRRFVLLSFLFGDERRS
jgi:predicted 2-oxoglutarate/Fe(II)-dependent dioxygenase YbiX